MATTLRGDDNFDTAIAQKAVVQTHVATASSQTSNASTITNITGLSAAITPSTSSKKVKITVRWSGEFSNTGMYESMYGIRRGSTVIGNPAAAGNRQVGMAPVAITFHANASTTADSAFYVYIDSPSTTSATTYYATHVNVNAGTLYNNRTVEDADSNGRERLTSSIILEEVD